MTEQEYILLINRERLYIAREVLSHVMPSDIVDEDRLNEISRQITEWQQECDRQIVTRVECDQAEEPYCHPEEPVP